MRSTSSVRCLPTVWTGRRLTSLYVVDSLVHQHLFALGHSLIPAPPAQVDEAKQQGDPVACLIARLVLERNSIVLRLEDSFAEAEESEEDSADDEEAGSAAEEDGSGSEAESDNDDENQERANARRKKARKPQYLLVEVDLELSAFANARKV